jgi:uncharacterized membrane protein
MVSASGIRAPKLSVLAGQIAGIALAVESGLELGPPGLELELVLVLVRELELERWLSLVGPPAVVVLEVEAIVVQYQS